MPAPPFAVNNHPQKNVIVQRILDGLPIRTVILGLVPPVSISAAQRYKASVIKPIIARAGARERNVLGSKAESVSRVPLSDDTKGVAQEVRDEPVLSIFRARLEELNGTINRTLKKAESAVRLATDKDGNQVVVGADIGVMAPLLNQAHKNIEMLGRATGELEPQGGTGVSIQILCPIAGSSPDQMPRISYADADAIEVAAAPAAESPAFGDIGVLQA